MIDAGRLMSIPGQSAAEWAAGGQSFKLQKHRGLGPPEAAPPNGSKPNKGKEAEKTEQKAQSRKPDLDPKEKKADTKVEHPQKAEKAEGPSKSETAGAVSTDPLPNSSEVCFAAAMEICVARQPGADINFDATDDAPLVGICVEGEFSKSDALAMKLKANANIVKTDVSPSDNNSKAEVVGRPVWVGNGALPNDIDVPIKAVGVDSAPQDANASDGTPHPIQPAQDTNALASDNAPASSPAVEIAPAISNLKGDAAGKLKIESALKAAAQDVKAEKIEKVEKSETKSDFQNRNDVWSPAADIANAKAAEHAQKVAPAEFNDLFAKAKVLEQIADRIEALAAAKPRGGVTIHLEPRELGTITLVVKSSGADIDARLSASDQNVRKALADSMVMLRAALEAKGMTIGSLSVANEHSASFGFGHHANQSAHRHGVPANFHGYSADANDHAMPWTFQSGGSGIDLWI